VSPSPNFSIIPVGPSTTTATLGQTVSFSFKLKNNLTAPITIDAVGAVGRIESPYSTFPNRDFGWQGPVTFAAGEEKTFNFSRTISEVKDYYVWGAYYHGGRYVQYNNWGAMIGGELGLAFSPSLASISLLNKICTQ
jgi:hypothetical protein